MDSNALYPYNPSDNPLTIWLLAVGGNQIAWRKDILKSLSGINPHIYINHELAYIIHERYIGGILQLMYISPNDT